MELGDALTLMAMADQFQRTYGQAVMRWAYIEHRLSAWFGYLTGLKPHQARAVYFSANSFRSRSDMLRAVLTNPPYAVSIPDEAAKFIEDALTKAITYSSHRNDIVHGRNVKFGGIDCIIQDKNDPNEELATAKYEKDLIHLMNNFNMLSYLIEDGLGCAKRGAQGLERLQEYHEQLLMLPSHPYSREPSQKQRGQQLQRKLARKKPQSKPDPKADEG